MSLFYTFNECQLAASAGILVAQLLLQRCKSLIIADACAAAASIRHVRSTPITEGRGSHQTGKALDNVTFFAAAPATNPSPQLPAAPVSPRHLIPVASCSVIEQRSLDDSAAKGSQVTQASLLSTQPTSSDTQPSTPLSVKMSRRQQLMQHELVSGGEGGVHAARCDDGAGFVVTDSAYERSEPSFSSVAAQLEEEDPNRRHEEPTLYHREQQQHLTDKACNPLPIVTPRDSAVDGAPLCTPLVFSTLHLKSPTQVKCSRCVQPRDSQARVAAKAGRDFLRR